MNALAYIQARFGNAPRPRGRLTKDYAMAEAATRDQYLKHARRAGADGVFEAALRDPETGLRGRPTLIAEFAKDLAAVDLERAQREHDRAGNRARFKSVDSWRLDPSFRRALVRNMALAGLPAKEIARQADVSIGTAYDALRAVRVPDDRYPQHPGAEG